MVTTNRQNNKTRNIYVNSDIFYTLTEMEKMYKEYCEELEEDDRGPITPDDFRDNFLPDIISEEWYILQEEISVHEKNHGKKNYLIIADMGLWYGRVDGGKIISGLTSALSKCFEDYNKVYMDGKRLMVEAIHHDGTNYFQIRELTKKGEEYIEKFGDVYTKEFHRKLFCDSHLTHEVSMFDEIYGKGWK